MVRAALATALLLFATISYAKQPVSGQQHADASGTHTKPNILFILVDDLGKEWLPHYEGESPGTPNMDELASTGVVFDNAYVNPQCTPTRMSLLTGQYPYRHGWVNHWDVPRWGHGYYDWAVNPSLGRTMNSAGYATAVAGKWQVNDFRLVPDAMSQHGFDEYLMWTGYESGNPPSAERYWDPYLHGENGSMTHRGAFGDELFTDFLLSFIEEHSDRPWFVYYPMALPHVPFTSTPTDPDVVGDDQQFRAMVRYLDTTLGRFLRTLERTGQSDNTIIIWLADNGSDPAVTGTRNTREIAGAKSLTIEAGVNVPLLIRAPGIRSGTRHDALVDATDFYPTLAELAGAPIPANFVLDGYSFAPLLQGDAEDSSREWIMAMGGQNRAQVSDQGIENEYSFRDRVIRDKQFKVYVKGERPLAFEKMVDLTADPDEQTDLLDSDDPNVRAALMRFREVAEQQPTRDNDPQYRSRDPNAWDVPVSVESQAWKK